MPRGQYDREAAAAKRAVTSGDNSAGDAPMNAPSAILTPSARADEVRQERRKRPGQGGPAGIKLALDESKLDRNTYHYRFARSSGGRLQSLHADDYDVAPEAARKDTTGSINAVHGGVDDAGKPYELVLVRKRRDWFEADQKEKLKPLDEMDEAIRRNNPNHKANDMRGPGVYSPGINSMEKA